MSSLVRPEFGPTLPELAGPRLRALAPWARVALAVGAVAVVAVILAIALARDDGREVLVVRGPVTFNLLYQPDRLHRAAPLPGEALRLRTGADDPDPESVAIRPVRLPPYTGDPSGTLPVYASGLVERMRRADPAFVLRSEGRARVNRQPGYQIQFQTSRGGRTVYGRRALLFKDEPGVRDGADILLLATRSPSIPNVDAVGSNGPTKLPYRSFRFGAERP